MVRMLGSFYKKFWNSGDIFSELHIDQESCLLLTFVVQLPAVNIFKYTLQARYIFPQSVQRLSYVPQRFSDFVWKYSVVLFSRFISTFSSATVLLLLKSLFSLNKHIVFRELNDGCHFQYRTHCFKHHLDNHFLRFNCFYELILVAHQCAYVVIIYCQHQIPKCILFLLY